MNMTAQSQRRRRRCRRSEHVGPVDVDREGLADAAKRGDLGLLLGAPFAAIAPSACSRPLRCANAKR
jgi:hypothetical protein